MQIKRLGCKSGFVIIPVVIIVVLAVVGSVVFYQAKINSGSLQTKNEFSSETNYSKEDEEKFEEHNGGQGNSEAGQKVNPYLGVPCNSNTKIAFPNDFTDVNKISSVEPTIITPGNPRHRAWLNIQSGKVPVYAPVDSELVNGVYKDARGAIDYDLHFQVSCEIWYLINHVTEPVEKVKNLFPAIPQTDTRIGSPFKQTIKVKASELIGYTTGTPVAHNFDFGVFDLNHENEGLPADSGATYGKEKNFICPFDVLSENLKKSYYSKIIASEKPYTNCKAF